MEPELDRLGEKLNQAETAHDAATTLIDQAFKEIGGHE